jgi:hypothetical protein
MESEKNPNQLDDLNYEKDFTCLRATLSTIMTGQRK